VALIPSGKLEYLGIAPAAAAEAVAGVSVALSVSPSAPNHGDTVTATYTVSGLAPSAGTPVAVNGSVTIGGGTPIPVTGSFTLPGAPAATVTYAVPTCPGLAFKATANPAVFTAVVP
jgi:hypothetical protein